MAKKSKKVMTDEAAALTETSEAIAMMAMELTEPVADEASEWPDVDGIPMGQPDGTPGPQKDGAIVAEPEVSLEEMAEAISTMPADLDPAIEDVKDVVEVLEASEAVSEPQASTVSEPEACEGEPTDPVASFVDVLASISQEERIAATVAMANAVDERAAFEAAGGNENIQKSLKAARIAFTMPDAGAVLLACGVDEAFVNRSVHDGKRYNVYALGKLADAVNGLAKGAVTNRINNAIMRSLFAARKANIPFTGEMAKMAASDKIRIADKKIEAILVRHTVSTVTAATQASSTMQALETLGLVARSGHKNPVYTLTNSPAVARLEQVLSQAA